MKQRVVTVALAVTLCIGTAQAQRAPIQGTHGGIATAQALASQVGLDVLKRGGNAIDAAVAVGFALAVVFPRAGNLGGGGFAVLHLANGADTSVDFRELAPESATRTMFEVDPARSSTVGYLSSGVPGTVDGLALLEARYGSHRLTWAQLIEPARKLAADGFKVSMALSEDIGASQSLLARFAESRRIFLHEGRLPREGETFRQTELARTLRRLQRGGAGEFYHGKTARLIAADMRAHGGLITRDDLAHYHAVERPVLHGEYRGYTVVTMPPPSSGGIALLQMLDMLSSHDVAALGTTSAEKIHLFTEVMRRAFADRAGYLGDPDFVHVPVEHLLNRSYLDARMTSFDAAHATSTLAAAAPAAAHESTETTQFSTLDADGNAVSITYTLNGLWGSGVTVQGAGFLLNDEMDDFTTRAGAQNMYGLVQSDANAIAPRKRPLSSMTPTILLKAGRPVLVTGSPGGPTIINTVLLVITGIVDDGLSVTQAVDAPRFHHQWKPDVINYEPGFTSDSAMKALERQGHALVMRELYPNAPAYSGRTWGDAESIAVDPASGVISVANDLRSPDSAALAW